MASNYMYWQVYTKIITGMIDFFYICYIVIQSPNTKYIGSVNSFGGSSISSHMEVTDPMYIVLGHYVTNHIQKKFVDILVQIENHFFCPVGQKTYKKDQNSS